MTETPLPGIELDRTFLEIPSTQTESDSEKHFSTVLALGRAKAWQEILKHRHVVVLGEAGTGKTTEFRRRAASLTGTGEAAFFVEVVALASGGLRSTLLVPEEVRLDAWMVSAGDAVFFLDSLDEAKLQQRTLREGLVRLQRELRDQWHRVRLVISCRVTDWRDSDRVAIQAVVPPEQAGSIFVVQIAPLDRRQLATLAAYVGVRDVDEFVRAVAESFAESFAQRPLDIAWLGAYWNRHGRIGQLCELIRENIDEKLTERSPQRQATLPLARARDGAQCLAGIATLTRRLSVALPGDIVDVRRAQEAIDTLEVFADWSGPEIEELLRAGLFDESTYGRVRFHHRTIQDFLAARWLHELRNAGLSLQQVRQLFLRDEAGELVVPQHLRPVLAWLCLWDSALRAEMIREAPALLIAYGDPSGFTEQDRTEILRAYAACYKNRSRLFHDFEDASLERFSTAALAVPVNTLLAQQRLPEELVALLFEIVKAGSIRACLSEALRVALNTDYGNRARITAIRAVAAVGDAEHRRQLVGLLNATQTWPQDVAGAFIQALYPEVIRVDELIRVLERCEPKQKNLITLLQSVLEFNVPKLGDAALRLKLLERLLNLVRVAEDVGESVATGRDWMLRSLACLLCAVLDDLPPGAEQPTVVYSVLEFFQWCDEHGLRTWDGVEQVREAVARHPEVRRYLFWNRVQDLRQQTGRVPGSQFELRYRNDLCELTADDAAWLVNDARSRPDLRERLLAFDVLACLPRSSEANEHHMDMIREVARSDPALQKRLKRMLRRTPVSSPKAGKWARQRRANELREERTRIENRAELEKNIDSIRNGTHVNALLFLLRCSQEKGMSSNRRNASTETLRDVYGSAIADAAEQGWRVYWRTHTPSLPHERERNRRPGQVIVGLVGLTIDFAKGLDPASLDRKDVIKATRYAASEMNAFPEWFEALAAAHPAAVREVLQPTLDADYHAQENVHDVLAKLSSAGSSIKAVCAPLVLDLIAMGDPPTVKALVESLGIVFSVHGLDLSALDVVIAGRCQTACKERPRFAVWWLAWACRHGEAAVEFLARLVQTSTTEDSYEFVLHVCQRIHEGIERAPVSLRADLASLTRLVPIVYEFIAPNDDLEHEDAYSPGLRDNAQEVRGWLLKWITDIAGPESVAALRRIADDPRVASAREWILQRAEVRLIANAGLREPDITELLVNLYRQHGTSARVHIAAPDGAGTVVKILFIASNPRARQRSELEIDEEARDIENKMRSAKYRDSFLFKTRWAVRPLDLQQLLLEERPTIMHFSGHGDGVAGLAFHGEDAEHETMVSSAMLLELFRVHGKGVRVLVLNACHSIVQARELTDAVDFVVGMRYAIGDEAARHFAAGFYRALGFGGTVQAAFDQGSLELKLAGMSDDAAVPVLLQRVGVDAASVALVEK